MINIWIYVTGICAIFIIITAMNNKVRFVADGMRANKIIWFSEWLLLDFILSMRKMDSGADTEVYVQSFLNRDTSDFEPLFNFINGILRDITDNYHLYFFIIYGFMIACYLLFVYELFGKESDFATLLFCFSIYIQMFNLLRQWFAVCFGLLAVALWKRGKRIAPIIICIVSFFIHHSMILYIGVFILCYYVWKHRVKINYNILLLIAAFINLVTYIYRNNFIEYISHTGYRAYVMQEMLQSVSWLGYIPTIVFLIVCIYFGKKIENISEGDDFNKYMLLFAFANLSLIYVNTGLGMWRLTQILFPIRVYLAYQLVKVLVAKCRWGWQRITVRYLASFFVVLSAVRYISDGIRYIRL